MKKRIAILGSTGSIGTQTLEVISEQPDSFVAEVLTAGNNADLLIAQAIEYQPDTVIIGNETLYPKVKQALANFPIKVYAGADAIAQIVQNGNIDIVLTAMVGFSGLVPTINAIKSGKTIALANKETLVVAGDLISRLVAEHHVNIFPVDSEHSAIFQCLTGEIGNEIEKIYLTASGGPFRGKSAEFLKTVTKAQALKHPNWDMGAKITIDSATLMNKGLEAIEAKWLFNLKPEQIEVVIHPQSIVHSAVQFRDGSVKAQLGLPVMKLPIQYALAYPDRLPNSMKRFSFFDYPQLTFEKPDFELFPNLRIAFEVMELGGNMPCVMNAANEIAVEAFLNDRISFLDIARIIVRTIETSEYIASPTLTDYQQTDANARQTAERLIK